MTFQAIKEQMTKKAECVVKLINRMLPPKCRGQLHMRTVGQRANGCGINDVTRFPHCSGLLGAGVITVYTAP